MGSMRTKQLAGNRHSGYWGRTLVALGVVALLADLAFLAVPLEQLAEKLKSGFISFVAALAMSVLNAVQAVEFHQVDYFSLISRILVLFSAMVAVIIGIALLRARAASAATPDQVLASSFRKQETE